LGKPIRNATYQSTKLRHHLDLSKRERMNEKKGKMKRKKERKNERKKE
jgi:hypothetical protein